jgi:hypothetical protein
MNALPVLAKPTVADRNSSSSSSSSSSSETQESEIVAFSLDNKNVIEGALIDDVLHLKRKNGKTDRLSVKGINRAANDESRVLWNLYCFYVVKDVWRLLRHEEKLIGQANLTLVVHSDRTYRIKRHALYVPGCRPCIENDPVPPKAQAFWKQVQASFANIEFQQMKIPDSTVESLTMEIVLGRDLSKFPRYPFVKYKGLLVRDKKGDIKRAERSRPVSSNTVHKPSFRI